MDNSDFYVAASLALLTLLFFGAIVDIVWRFSIAQPKGGDITMLCTFAFVLGSCCLGGSVYFFRRSRRVYSDVIVKSDGTKKWNRKKIITIFICAIFAVYNVSSNFKELTENPYESGFGENVRSVVFLFLVIVLNVMIVMSIVRGVDEGDDQA